MKSGEIEHKGTHLLPQKPEKPELAKEKWQD
jgi:hypothetical protein